MSIVLPIKVLQTSSPQSQSTMMKKVNTVTLTFFQTPASIISPFAATGVKGYSEWTNLTFKA